MGKHSTETKSGQSQSKPATVAVAAPPPKKHGAVQGKPKIGSGPAPKPPKSEPSLAIVPALDFGEHVANTSHKQRLPAVRNLRQSILTVDYHVTGDRFRLMSESTVRLPAAQDTDETALRWLVEHAPTIVFAPMRRGPHHGTLVARVRETNETFVVPIRGKSRLANEPADNSDVIAQRAHEKEVRQGQEKETARQRKIEEKRIADDRKRPNGPPRVWSEDWDAALEKTRMAASALAKAQWVGMDLVDREAVKFVRQLPPKHMPLWWMLVEVGLTMATAGIASSVAKGLLPRLLANREFINEFPGHAVEEVVIAKLSEFTTDSIKEGLKLAGKKAIAEIGPAPSRQGQQQGGSRGPYSSDFEANFFAKHSEILIRQESTNRELLDERARALKPLWRERDKMLPIRMLTSITEALKNQANDAISVQSRITTAMWMSAISQHSQGAEQALDGTGAPVAASSLEASHKNAARTGRDGLLDVLVTKHFPTSVLSVRSRGVAVATLDRLLQFPLRAYPMPVRIIANPNDHAPTIITRDEAGRVRVTGDENWLAKIAAKYGESVESRSESAAAVGGRVIVETVLGDSLGSQGVTMGKIDHDQARTS